MSGLVNIQLLLSFCMLCTGMYLTRYTDCGGHGTIHSILLEPCDHEPCNIPSATTFQGTINFTSGINSQNATNKATADFAVIMGQFHVKQPNACGHRIICPVVKGETYTYTSSVTSPNFNSSLRGAAKWMVEGDIRDEYIICFVFPVVVVK